MNKKYILSFILGFLLISFTGCGDDSKKGVLNSFKEDYSKITPVVIQEYEAAKFDSMKKEIFNSENDSNPSRKAFSKKDLRTFALNYIDNVSKPGSSNYNDKSIKFINFFEDGDSEIIKRVFLQYSEYDNEFKKFIMKIYEKDQDGKQNKIYEKSRKIVEENLFELASLSKQKVKLLETFYNINKNNKDNMNFDTKNFISKLDTKNLFLFTFLKDEQIKSNSKEIVLSIFKDELKLTTPDYKTLLDVHEFKILFESIVTITFDDKEIESFMKKTFIPNSKLLNNKSINDYYEKNKEKLDLESKNEMRENYKKAVLNHKISKDNLMYLEKTFLDDKEFMEFLIERKNFFPVVYFASERLKNDKDFVLKAMKYSPYEYQYISDSLKNDPSLVLQIIEQYKTSDKRNGLGSINVYAGKEIRNNKDVIVEMLKLNFFNYESFPKEMYKNYDVLYYMIKQYESEDRTNNYWIDVNWKKYASEELKSKYKTPREFLKEFEF